MATTRSERPHSSQVLKQQEVDNKLGTIYTLLKFLAESACRLGKKLQTHRYFITTPNGVDE
jgi:hypothetical protein